MGYPFYSSEKTAVKTMGVTGRRILQLTVQSKLWWGSKRKWKIKTGTGQYQAWNGLHGRRAPNPHENLVIKYDYILYMKRSSITSTLRLL